MTNDPDHSLEGWYVKLDALLLSPDLALDRVQLEIRALLRNLKATHDASTATANRVARDYAAAAARFEEASARARAVLRAYEVQVHQHRT